MDQCVQKLHETLQRLAEDGSPIGRAADVSRIEPLTVEELTSCRECSTWVSDSRNTAACVELWESLARAEVSFVAVAKSIGQLVRGMDSLDGAMLATAFYSILLNMKDCPTSSLFDPYTFSGFLQTLKKACVPGTAQAACGKSRKADPDAAPEKDRRKGSKKAATVQHSDDEAGSTQNTQNDSQAQPACNQELLPLCVEALTNIECFVRGSSLRGSPDMQAMLLDACVEITASGSSIMAASAARSGRGAARSQATGPGTAPEAAYLVLCALMEPQHGDVAVTASSTLLRLIPSLLGAAGTPAQGAAAKKAAGQDAATRRARAVQFISALYRQRQPEVSRSLVALLRGLCLKAPDRADCRAATVTSLQEMVPLLPGPDLLLFTSFLARLARTAKPLQRHMAVEVAHTLLHTLPEPFALAAGYKSFLDGSHGPGEEIVAPWSATCLAILLQRCDDKAAVVRARALAHLADALTTFSSLVTSSPSLPHGDPGAAPLPRSSSSDTFLLALCGASTLQMKATLMMVGAPPEPSLAAAAPVQAVVPAKAGGRGRGAGKGHRGGRGGRGAAEDSGSSDEGEGVAKEGGPAAVVPGAARAQVQVEELVAVLPSRMRLDLRPLMALAHRRLLDSKAPVRKCGLSLLEGGMLLRAGLPAPAGGPPSQEDITAVEAATADPLLSVRKAALGAACRLVAAFPEDPSCCELWVRSALPMVRDGETSIQDAVLEAVQQLLLGRIATAATAHQSQQTQAAVRSLRPLLAAVAAGGRATTACIAKACSLLAGRKELAGKQVARGLEHLITLLSASSSTAPAAGPAAKSGKQPSAAQQLPGPGEDTGRAWPGEVLGAWMVLREVAAVAPAAPSWLFLQSCWQQLQASGRSGSKPGAGEDAAGLHQSQQQEGAELLWVISHVAAHFPAQEAVQLADNLLKALMAFTLPPAPAAAHVSALHRLASNAPAKGDGAKDACQGAEGNWASKLLEGAHQQLSRVVEARGKVSEAAAWKASVALSITGEVALLKAARMPSHLVLLVQALTSPAPVNQAASQAAPGGGTDAAPQAGLGTLCGPAWVCLGKLCIVDESLAKRCAPLMVQELTRSPSPVVRNNCLVALADMCIHFTALVDSYLPRLSALIRDPHDLVRKQALALLANLLMKDYVKWRGALFHRFALALVDSCAEVRQLAEYLLGDTLATKAPLLAYNHFVEAIFVLNGCQAGLYAGRIGGGGGPGGGPASASQASDALAAAADPTGAFSLKGESSEMRAQRDVVYHTLLRRMSPEHKFATQAKLVAEVLGAVADGLLPLQEQGAAEVLGDALRLLASKHIKVSTSRMVAGDEDALMAAAGGEAAGAGATQAVAEVAKAKGKLVSAMMKKHLVESVVPLLVELKAMLSETRHPLLGPLMTCMVALLREHKGELEDILVAHKQLAKELLFDMKQAEVAAKQQAVGGVAAAPAALAAPALPPGPPPHALPLGASARTPLAAEVLAASGRKQAAGATGAGTGAGTASRPAAHLLQRAAALGSAASTPGAATDIALSTRSPGAALHAARTPRLSGASIVAQQELEGSQSDAAAIAGATTPRRSGARAAVAAAAPLSTRAAAAAAGGSRRAGLLGRDVDDDGAMQHVLLPVLGPADMGQMQQWGVALPDAAERAAGRRSGGSQPQRRSGAAAAATAALTDITNLTEALGATEAHLQGPGSKPAGRGEGRKAAAGSTHDSSQACGAGGAVPAQLSGKTRRGSAKPVAVVSIVKAELQPSQPSQRAAGRQARGKPGLSGSQPGRCDSEAVAAAPAAGPGRKRGVRS